MGVTKDQRKEKIKELKSTIKLAQEELKAFASLYQKLRKEVPDAKENPEEHAKQMTHLKSQMELLQQKSSILEALAEELKLTKMNKNSSRMFEWHPSPPNRRMRRAMARM
jgi:chromosome segregation ATPase